MYNRAITAILTRDVEVGAGLVLPNAVAGATGVPAHVLLHHAGEQQLALRQRQPLVVDGQLPHVLVVLVPVVGDVVREGLRPAVEQHALPLHRRHVARVGHDVGSACTAQQSVVVIVVSELLYVHRR